MRSPFLTTSMKLFALLVLCVVPLAAPAFTFCVSNPGALQLALSVSSDGGAYGTEPNIIRVVAGTYSISALANQTFHYSNTSATGSLNLQGGWNAGCSVRTPKASLTVLDGNHANQVLSLRQVANELDLTNFTIQNGDTTASGGGVEINPFGGDNSRVVVTGNIIRNNHTTDRNGGITANAGTSNLYFYSNVLYGNSADAGYGAGQVLATNVLSVTSSTIAYNTTSAPGGVGGLRVYVGAATGFITRSIFWGNSNCGITLATTNVRLDSDDFGTRCGMPPLTELDDLNIAPQFVDYSGGDFHLAANSPLFGTVSGYFGAIDADGNPGSASGAMDMGAYFDTIFGDGVEGN